VEEQLRQLSAVNDEQPRPVAQQNLAELHLQQLIARYALLKQKALD
jgi:type VI secretion system protein VasL